MLQAKLFSKKRQKVSFAGFSWNYPVSARPLIDERSALEYWHRVDNMLAFLPGNGGTAARAEVSLLRLFWIVGIGLSLAPIWSLEHFPTQDGPAHLYHAHLIKNLDQPGARYSEFFEIRREPIPNWLTQAIFSLFFGIMSPLCAEKVVLSLYVVGFALGFAYFLHAVRPQALWLPLLALPLAFNRCLWMGFYNYCLGMVLFWWILGYFLRRQEHWRWRDTVVLMAMSLLIYFAHLVTFLLAGAALVILACGSPRPFRNLVRVVAAFIPACPLAGIYFASGGFAGASLGTRSIEDTVAKLRSGRYLSVLEPPLLMFDKETFGPTIDTLPWAGLPLLILTLSFFAAAMFVSGTELPRRGRFASLFTLLSMIAVLYLILPDQLGREGGYLKQRFPPLLWLLVIAVTPEPKHLLARAAFAVLVATVLIFHAALNFAYAQSESRAVAEIVRGREAMGANQVYYSIFAERYERLSNPLLHAADYFALGTGNINLQNYQANRSHFPVKFKDVAFLSADNLGRSPYGARITAYVFWDVRPQRFAHLLKDFESVHRDGKLEIWRKKLEKRSP